MSKNKIDRMASDVLREAIRDSGLTLYRIAKDTGIRRSSIARFCTGETSLHLSIADRLIDYLDLELTRRGK